MMLPVYESLGETLKSHGDHEFFTNPARHDILQIVVSKAIVPMKVMRLEHRVMDILSVSSRSGFPTKLLLCIVIVERVANQP